VLGALVIIPPIAPDHALDGAEQVSPPHRHRAADHIFKHRARARAGQHPGRQIARSSKSGSTRGGAFRRSFVRALRSQGKKAAKVASSFAALWQRHQS